VARQLDSALRSTMQQKIGFFAVLALAATLVADTANYPATIG
jgi:hypothetical protein